MEIAIDLEEAKNGEFSKINLLFNDLDDNQQIIPLVLYDFVNAFDLTNDKSSVKFDLFLVSALVYGVDNLLDRKYYSIDGWARELKVTFPVYNLSSWLGQEKLLEDTLKFLTGDHWEIEFRQNHISNMFMVKNGRWTKNIRQYNIANIRTTSLFSGGLDSLIGIIDQIENLNDDEEILLVSHFDFSSSGPKKDQDSLFAHFKKEYQDRIKDNWIRIRLSLGRRNQHGDEFTVEGNYRSRSLFFIGLGCYVSQSLNLVIPENGTISINYPLTPSRVSSLSTRTTHPFVLSSMQELLNSLDISVELHNPYSLKTKGEMILECQNRTLLNAIYSDSTSCGKPGHNYSWENRTASHCGVCMPCVYRRSALNRSGDDTQAYGRNITQPLTKNSFTDLPALISYLKKEINLEQMKRDILVNGSIPLNELDLYARMVLRSRDEVKQLFVDKGNEFIKAELGINAN